MHRSRLWAALALALIGAACADGDDAMDVPDGPSREENPVTGNADAGEADAAADAAGGESADVPPGAIEPIIPAPNGECPELTTGTHEIMGLTTEIVAGEPGDTRGPMLFTWHGTNGSGPGALRQLPQSVQDEITSLGGLVIAPTDNGAVRAGADVTFVLGVWYDVADLEFADHLVACAVENHNIDPRRIYATGCSAGGLMAGVMSMLRSSYVAAAAPNSGGIATPGGYVLQDALRVPAVMTMHGGMNDNVIVNFGDTSGYLAAELSAAGGFFVDCNHMIGHCAAPAELHEQAWRFMMDHPFGYGESPYAAELPAEFPEYCVVQ